MLSKYLLPLCLVLLASWVLVDAASAQAPRKRPRRLAPGVLTVIPTATEEEETFTGPFVLRDLVGRDPMLNWSPFYMAKSSTIEEQARRVILRRDVWSLEFAFKPLRMVEVDVPQPNGKMQRKLVWYMVYRVKNNGKHLNPVATVDPKFGHKTYGVEALDKDVRFFPSFVLETKDLKNTKAYLDRVIPAALGPIQEREDPNVKLLNSVEISKVAIPVSDPQTDKSVWGVVTWEDIDPRVDYLAIYVQGLTNAFRFEETTPGKKSFTHKTLQLNFWRPGDANSEGEERIRYGIRLVSDAAEQQSISELFGLEKPLDHVWVYR